MKAARRFSKQRQIIYDCVVQNPIHPSADMVYQLLKEKNPKLSLGTVYRNLNLLADMGLIQRLHVDSASERFDGSHEKHYHMICQNCGDIFDIPIVTESTFISDIQNLTAHQLKDYHLIFNGLCQGCQK